MRVLSHPRVPSPLGYAASTWFSRSVVLPQRQGPFHLLATTDASLPSTLWLVPRLGWAAGSRSRRLNRQAGSGGGDLRPRWSAPGRRAAAGEVSSASGTFSPAEKRGGSPAEKRGGGSDGLRPTAVHEVA